MTVPLLQAIREVQIPLVAFMLLAGCITKVRQMRRTGSLDSGLGPTALFPLSMRKPVALVMCLVEAILGVGLIVTASGAHATGGSATATVARLGAGLLFLIATSTLIELRTVRPDVGCGCFGELSTAPVSGRTIARSALLAVAILSTLGFRVIGIPHTGTVGLELLAIVCAELLLIGFLSPEIGAGLIRLGYSEPCELRHVPSTRTLTALRRSKQWRRYSRLIASDLPADIWRELCWRYVVYPITYEDRPADLVFAVFLQYRRPLVHAALVDSATGLPLPLPTTRGRFRRAAPSTAPSAAAAADAADLPVSPNTAAAHATDRPVGPNGAAGADAGPGAAAAAGAVAGAGAAAAADAVETADAAETTAVDLLSSQP